MYLADIEKNRVKPSITNRFILCDIPANRLSRPENSPMIVERKLYFFFQAFCFLANIIVFFSIYTLI